MTTPLKLPIVTRWATNLTDIGNGFKNRLSVEPPQSFIDQGFSTPVLIRQLLNYVLYNHGENLTYSTYYVNKPFRVGTKSALPSASNNNGVIYFVEDVNKLVMSINSKWMILATATTELS
mgnify:FL=1